MYMYIYLHLRIQPSYHIEVYAICLAIGMKYRDKNGIIAQILESANGNRIGLTKIMYDVYLSHAITRDYRYFLSGGNIRMEKEHSRPPTKA